MTPLLAVRGPLAALARPHAGEQQDALLLVQLFAVVNFFEERAGCGGDIGGGGRDGAGQRAPAGFIDPYQISRPAELYYRKVEFR